MELTMQEKLRLINFFEFQLDKEVSKPLGQMDSNAVDLYIKVLLDLQDKHIELSPEFIDEQVRKIFHPEESAPPEAVKTTKKYFNKKKVWLVAACIAILVALFSIISVANDWNVFDFLSEKFGSVHSTPIEKELEFNGVCVFNIGSGIEYKTVEEACKEENVKILYPNFLPQDIKLTELMFHQDTNIQKMIYSFNNSNLHAEISFNSKVSKDVIKDSTETKVINSITCYICEISDISSYQIEFEYKGDSYYFSYTDKDILLEIIKNLEEKNNEN